MDLSEINQRLKKYTEIVPEEGDHIRYLETARKLMEQYSTISGIMDEEATPKNDEELKEAAKKIIEITGSYQKETSKEGDITKSIDSTPDIDEILREFAKRIPPKGMHISYLLKSRELMNLYDRSLELINNPGSTNNIKEIRDLMTGKVSHKKEDPINPEELNVLGIIMPETPETPETNNLGEIVDI